MLIWETADHILIDFQTVLSQKHIITCQSIYNAALVKNEQYSFFFSFFSSNLAEGWETVGKWWIYYREAYRDSTRNQFFVNYTVCGHQSKHVQHGPICRSTSAEGLAEVHRVLIPLRCLEAGLRTRVWGEQGVAGRLAMHIQRHSWWMWIFPKPHSDWS